MSKLTLGRKPDDLEVFLVKGDPWSQALTLKQAGTNTPWPAAPVLEFGDGTNLTATLSNASATATWNATEAQVAALLDAQQRPLRVRLSVEGLTWWAGTVRSGG